MTNFCTHCGQRLQEHSRFCSRCGKKQEEPFAAQTATQPSPSSLSPSLRKNKTRRKPLTLLLLLIFLLQGLLVALYGWPGYLKDKALDGPEPYMLTPLSITYTQKELDAAPMKSLALTSDTTFGTIEGIEVQFQPWHLPEEDTFILRTLEEKVQEDLFTTIKAYDFSMASGKTEFTTSVEIRIPRTVQENEIGSLVSFHPDTNTWHYIYHEVSEDGLYYTLYTTHFSLFGEKKRAIGVATDTEAGSYNKYNVSGGLFHDLYGVDEKGNPLPLIERSVAMDDASFAELVQQALSNEEVQRILQGSKIPIHDAFAFTFAMLSNGHSSVDGAMVVGHLHSSFARFKDLSSANKMATIGTALTSLRILYQLYLGGEILDVVDANKYNIVTSLLGITGAYVGAGMAATTLSAVSLGVFLWSLGVELYAMELTSKEKATYMFFLEVGNPHLRNRVNLRLNGRDFDVAIHHIYQMNIDTPERADQEIYALYEEFLDYFWVNMTKEEREAFAQKRIGPSPIYWKDPSPEEIAAMKKEALGILANNTKRVLEEMAKDQYRYAVELLHKDVHQELLPFLNQKLIFHAEDETLKNRGTFDDSPYSGYDENFPHGFDPMNLRMDFPTQVPILFVPKNRTEVEFSRPVFTPYPRKNSNIIYITNVYHYLQVGAPDKILFKGDEEVDLPDVLVNFTIPPQDLDRNIYIPIELKSDALVFEDILGTWSIQMDMGDVSSPFADGLIKLFDKLLGEGAGESIVEKNYGPSDTFTTENTVTIMKTGPNKAEVKFQTHGEGDRIWFYTGTFKKDTLHLRYAGASGGSSDAIEIDLEKMSLTFAKSGDVVRCGGQFDVRNSMIRATFHYNGSLLEPAQP